MPNAEEEKEEGLMELNEKIYSLYKMSYPRFEIVKYIKTSDTTNGSSNLSSSELIAKILPKTDFTTLALFFKRFNTKINFAEAVI
jgi:hypothetical protein